MIFCLFAQINEDQQTSRSSQGAAAENENAIATVKSKPYEGVEEMSLVQLNDDCLITVFRMLSMDDLTSISDTCSRFRAIASFVFELEHRIVDLNVIVGASKNAEEYAEEYAVEYA